MYHLPDTHPNLTPLHADLIKALAQKNLLPIAAAGVSMSVLNDEQKSIFPSWRELLQRAAQRLSESDEKSQAQADAITAMLGVKKYQLAADFARNGLTGNGWPEFFDEQFDVDLAQADLSLPEAIWALSRSIITLNYDRVMELANPNKLSLYDNQSAVELRKFAQRETQKSELWHLHGRIDNKKDIIFTSESYESLYKTNPDIAEGYQAAISRLKNLASTHHFLFIGCSMDDAELLEQLAQQNEIFANCAGPHFVMVQESEQATLQAKLQNCGVNFVYIPFKHFGQPLLNKVRQIGEHIPILSTPITPLKPITANSGQCKIAILSPQLLDHQLDFSSTLTELKKLKADLNFYPLNQQRLNALDEMDYIILLSQTSSAGILIEDDYLCRQSMPLDEVMDNIGNRDHKAVILFTDKALPLAALDDIDEALMVVPTFEKKIIGNFMFQVFNKHKKPFDFFDGLQLCHQKDFELTQLSNRDKSKITDCATQLPKDINQNQLKNTVGRLDDIESIVRKTIKLTSNPGGCLTIKGAGGLGKTTLAQKAVIALARDGRYGQGIYFIDASAMVDFAEFEYKIMQPFGLEGVQDAQEQLALQQSSQGYCSDQRLIVLDNGETLKYLYDSERIMSLLDYICQHCTLVATSREVLGVEYGDPYELRQFSTDEAEALFLQQSHFTQLSEGERRLLRQEILEGLLDNHPLAVKLIARAAVKGDNLTQLRDALINSNELLDNADMAVFNQPGDHNIKRQQSMFNCIAYSYEQLGIEEKNVFKILALFPDGLPSQQLKNISSDNKLQDKNEPYQAIKDQHIKALQNKSLIEESNGVQKLHAIVRRFAQAKIKKQENAAILYKKALKHNVALAQGLISQHSTNQGTSGIVYARASRIQNNLISAISQFGRYPYDVEKQLKYIENIVINLQGSNCRDQLIQALQNVSKDFIQSRQIKQYISIKIIWLSYYDGDFVRASKELQDCLSIEEILELDLSDWINRRISQNAMQIYQMEGDVIASIKIQKLRFEAGASFLVNYYPQQLYLLGEIDEWLIEHSAPNYALFDLQYHLGILDVDLLQGYFNELYEKDHINRMQSFYILAKAGKVEAEILNSLLVVNPYTAGLKQLMLAWQQSQADSAEALYQQALKNLFHIKYYYVEAQLYYCRFLKAQGRGEYTEQLALGLGLAKQHYYRLLQHQFIQLKAGTREPYHSDNYPLPEDLPLEEFKRLILRDFKDNMK